MWDVLYPSVTSQNSCSLKKLYNEFEIVEMRPTIVSYVLLFPSSSGQSSYNVTIRSTLYYRLNSTGPFCIITQIPLYSHLYFFHQPKINMKPLSNIKLVVWKKHLTYTPHSSLLSYFWYGKNRNHDFLTSTVVVSICPDFLLSKPRSIIVETCTTHTLQIMCEFVPITLTDTLYSDFISSLHT